MSELGDRIIEQGPYDETVHPRWGPESKSFLHSDINALRDELIELRAGRDRLHRLLGVDDPSRMLRRERP